MSDLIKAQWMSKKLNEIVQRNYDNPYMIYHEMLFLPSHQLMYVAVSKNACTQIKTILSDIKLYPKKLNRRKDPHNPKFSKLKVVADLSLDQVYDYFHQDQFFKFCFVRDPFKRLVSCYKNKLEQVASKRLKTHQEIQHNLEWQAQALKIKSFMTGKSIDAIDLIAAPVSFREFIEYVCEQDPYEMDRHWYHQTRAVLFDVINYQYIGKVERFDTDINYILTHINAPKNIYNAQEKLNRTDSKTGLIDYITSDIEKLIVNKFEEDFDNFNYSKYLVRPFHPVKIDILESNASLDKNNNVSQIQKKLSSPKEYLKNITIVFQTDHQFKNFRKMVISARKFLGPAITINAIFCCQPFQGITDFAAIHNVHIYFRADSESMAESYNFLIDKVTTDYFLIIEQDTVFTEKTNLLAAYNILQNNPNLMIVGGAIKELSAGTDECLADIPIKSNASVIFTEDSSQVACFLPIELISNLEIRLEEDFVSCDSVGHTALYAKSIFLQSTLKWDINLKGEICFADLFMQGYYSKEIEAVYLPSFEFSKFIKKTTNTLHAQQDISCFLNKWKLQQLNVIGEYCYIKNVIDSQNHYFPFYLKDFIKNISNRFCSPSCYNVQGFKEMESYLVGLKNQLQQIKNSRAWRFIKPIYFLFYG